LIATNTSFTFFQLNYPQANQPKNKPLANRPNNDPFHLHKVALRPLLHTLDQKETTALFDQLESIEQNEFITFLYRQGMEQMWLPFLLLQGTLPANFEETVKALKQDALHTAANQLMQRKILHDTQEAFKQASIDYLVFKGAHLRHTIYADPTHRPVCDIDILVRDGQKFDAVYALLKADFGAVHKAENISHETSLHKNNVWIDLHWHLMRPGRTRIDLNDYLFEQRQSFGEFVGLSNEASLLIMLIHPAITKYVNGSASSLRHLVDIHRLAQCDDINWERLIDMLDKSGTRTAAWASLTWLQMLVDEPMYEDLTDQLKPGGLKARWLRYWMGKDLNTKLAEKKMIIRAGFSLMLQDNWRDVINAVSTLKKEKQKAEETIKAL
jgi:hypothetical protein